MGNDKYALAYLSIAELPADTSGPATGDLTARFDASAGRFVKVDATDLSATSGITATAAEINRTADLTGRLVALTGTTAITVAAHEGRELYITGTAAAAYTLPEATGSGARFKFHMGQVNTNGTTFVAADTTNTSFRGTINLLDVDATAVAAYAATSGDDTITFNGTTTGGGIGDFLEFVDVATDLWFVFGQGIVPAGSNIADPWSSAA